VRTVNQSIEPIMNKREHVIKVEGAGADNDAGFILVYDCGDRVSLVASTEKNGDAEIILDKSAAALAEALRKLS